MEYISKHQSAELDKNQVNILHLENTNPEIEDATTIAPKGP